MKTFISVMRYLHEELPHEGYFVGNQHTRLDRMYIRRCLRELI